MMACGSAVQTNVFTLRNWLGSASLTESYAPPRHYTALASSRESGEGAAGTISASTRFPFPLIEPDARIFPIRLSDWFRCTHATCERVLRKLGQRRHSRPVHPISRASAAGQRLRGSGMLVGVVGLIANRRPWSSSQAHQNSGFSTGVTQLRGHMPLTNSRLTPRPAPGWGSPAPVHTSVPRSGLLPLGTRHACYPGGSAWVLGSIASRPARAFPAVQEDRTSATSRSRSPWASRALRPARSLNPRAASVTKLQPTRSLQRVARQPLVARFYRQLRGWIFSPPVIRAVSAPHSSRWTKKNNDIVLIWRNQAPHGCSISSPETIARKVQNEKSCDCHPVQFDEFLEMAG